MSCSFHCRFGINNDGEIFTLKVLDYELVDSYVFSVIARDNDTPQDAKEDTAQVTCIVDNLIDTPPRFLDDYETQVNEESVNLQPQITVQVRMISKHDIFILKKQSADDSLFNTTQPKVLLIPRGPAWLW